MRVYVGKLTYPNFPASAGLDVSSFESSSLVGDTPILVFSNPLTKLAHLQTSSHSAASLGVSTSPGSSGPLTASASAQPSHFPTSFMFISASNTPAQSSTVSIPAKSSVETKPDSVTTATNDIPSQPNSQSSSSSMVSSRPIAHASSAADISGGSDSAIRNVSSSVPNSSFPAAVPPLSSPAVSSDVKSSEAVKSSSRPRTNAENSSGRPPTKAPAPSSKHSSTLVTHAPVMPVSCTGTTTSTITDTPESTLARPSFISVVNSNGQTSFTAPPLVTILSTSREPNGSFVTFTHVVANPTGLNQAISGGHTSFFHNAGAVAGVFLVIGVILTAIVAFATFVMCRRRRRKREAHRRWLISINRPRPVSDPSHDPFEDPRSAPSPPMRMVPHAWDAPAAWDTQARPTRRESSLSDLGLLNLPAVQPNSIVEEKRQSQSNPRDSNEIGLAITTNESRQSSPSLYPPSLPTANDDHDDALEEVYRPPPPPSRNANASPPPPPRPRRSHLRETKGLLTPPSSVSDHSPVSELPSTTSPWGLREQPTIQLHGSSQLNEIMGRKTLLDIRPRSQDSVRTVRRQSD
ncbi:hypothetical protein R3P38DRAFT_33781 [Favolaschia claudopus]|uniref:Uncharacterized protein n=1 Tax=Favolaschia claudopus TaxID=2862362 RepID=A0AAW0EFR9_9AGAR